MRFSNEGAASVIKNSIIDENSNDGDNDNCK